VKLTRSAIALTAVFLLTGFVPGSSTSCVNATSGTITVACKTESHPNQAVTKLDRGNSFELSGDYSPLTWLQIKYATGTTITLSLGDLRRAREASTIRRGVWWIRDGGVDYISMREANIRKRKLFGRL
jgi:hypothetical protein